MTSRPFDYEYWREGREDWKDLWLHWHCHAVRMDGNSYGDEAARRSPDSELAPKVIRQWLNKPAHTIRDVSRSPEDALRWLRGQWEAVEGQIGEEAEAIPEETRFGMALYDLRCGSDVCWGFWLNASTHFHIAIIGTSAGCH